MLTDELAQMRRAPKPALIMLACGLVIGALLGIVFDGGSASTPKTPLARARSARVQYAVHTDAGHLSTGRVSTTGGSSLPPPATAGSNGATSLTVPSRGRLQSALALGVRRATSLGGEASAAAIVDGVGSLAVSGEVDAPHRMWSMSKAVASIAALEAVHNKPDPVLRSAMSDAIRRSDNCAIRRVILGLQQRVGGVSAAIGAFEEVLAKAKVKLVLGPSRATAETACDKYLEAHSKGLSGEVLGTAAQFGTAEWTVRDAARFAFALATGVYGVAGEQVHALMAAPKQGPLEEPAPPGSPGLSWGAGEAFSSSWKPAWKGGWGGSQDVPRHFIAGQIVTLEIAGRPAAVAASFAPTREPPNDNPGITEAPQALVQMFTAARSGIEAELIG